MTIALATSGHLEVFLRRMASVINAYKSGDVGPATCWPSDRQLCRRSPRPTGWFRSARATPAQSTSGLNKLGEDEEEVPTELASHEKALGAVVAAHHKEAIQDA